MSSAPSSSSSSSSSAGLDAPSLPSDQFTALEELLGLGADFSIRANKHSQRGLFTNKSIAKGEVFWTFRPAIRVVNGLHFNEVTREVGNICSCCHSRLPVPVDLLKPDSPQDLADLEEQEDPYEMSVFEELIAPSGFLPGPKPIYEEKRIKGAGCCARCELQLYCSRRCARFELPFHRIECGFLQNFREAYPEEVPDTVTRMVLRMTVLLSKWSFFRTQVKYMCDHGRIMEKQNDEYAAQMDRTVEVFKRLTTFEERVIRKLCRVLFINSTVLFDTFGEPIGQMFDSRFSMMNHSCEPNVEVYFNGPKCMVVAAKDIQKGNELFVNYILCNLPKVMRQVDLKQRFFFDCKCTKCSAEYDMHQAIRCAGCNEYIWDYSIQDYINGKAPQIIASRAKMICCRTNYKKIQTSQMDFYKLLDEFYNFRLGTSDKQKQFLNLIRSQYISAPEIYDFPPEEYVIIQKRKLDRLLRDKKTTIQAYTYPLSQISLVSEGYTHGTNGLDHLIYMYINYFHCTRDGPIYNKCLAMYEFVIHLLELRIEKRFPLSSYHDQVCTSKGVFSMLLSTLISISEVYSADSTIHKNICETIYIFICNYKHANERPPPAKLEREVAEWWDEFRLKIPDYNDAIADFGLYLKKKDPRFRIFNASLFFIESTEEHRLNAVEGLRDFIKNTVFKGKQM